MLIGLLDVDNTYRGKYTHPNLALMKLSAWHKSQGDTVEWYPTQTPLLAPRYDRVYVSKVFSDEYTRDYDRYINADEVIRGGSGYAIKIEGGKEVYHPELCKDLAPEVEHIMPDYSIYPATLDDGGHAYGFLTRGCPRGCAFCHVVGMQGRASRKVADLNEFWNGQKNIHLCDPNILACPQCGELFDQLIESGAYIDFNQGLDIRLLTDDRIEQLNRMKYKIIHFAWDKPQDDLRPYFINAKKLVNRPSKNNIMCFVLCNFGESFEDDVMRVEFLKSVGIQPYVMIYRKYTAPTEIKRLARYANNPYVCWATPTWEDYNTSAHSERFGNTGIKHKPQAKLD